MSTDAVQNRSLFEIVVKETSATEPVTDALVVIKKTFELLSELSKNQVLTNIVTFLTPATDTLQTLGVFGSVNSIIVQIKDSPKNLPEKWIKTLKITKQVHELGLSVFSIVDLGSRIGLIDLAKIAKTLGSTPVIGKGLVFFPLGTVVSIFETIIAVIEIATDSIQIHKYNSDVKKIKDKISLWGDLENCKIIAEKKKLHTLDKTQDKTKQFFNAKKEKWEKHLYNKPLQKIKAKKNIALNSVYIIATIASIALGLMGISTPIVAITFISAFLLISLATLATTVHDKYYLKEKKTESIPAPT